MTKEKHNNPTVKVGDKVILRTAKNGQVAFENKVLEVTMAKVSNYIKVKNLSLIHI